MSLFHNAHGERNPLRPIKSEKYRNKDIEIRYIFHKKYWVFNQLLEKKGGNNWHTALLI